MPVWRLARSSHDRVRGHCRLKRTTCVQSDSMGIPINPHHATAGSPQRRDVGASAPTVSQGGAQTTGHARARCGGVRRREGWEPLGGIRCALTRTSWMASRMAGSSTLAMFCLLQPVRRATLLEERSQLLFFETKKYMTQHQNLKLKKKLWTKPTLEERTRNLNG